MEAFHDKLASRSARLLLVLSCLCFAPAVLAQMPIAVGVNEVSGGGLAVDVRVLSPMDTLVGDISLEVELLSQDSLLDASLGLGSSPNGLLVLPGLDGMEGDPASERILPCEGVACGDDAESTLNFEACTDEDCRSEEACSHEEIMAGEEACRLDMPDKQPVVLEGVNFEFNSARLTADSADVLSRALVLIKQHPDSYFAIYGHTDSVGSSAYNLRLSRARAQAVRDYFLAAGVDSGRLVYHGYGSSRPLAPNTTETGADNPEGRAINRRVELDIVDEERFALLRREMADLEAQEEAQRRRRQQEARERSAAPPQREQAAAPVIAAPERPLSDEKAPSFDDSDYLNFLNEAPASGPPDESDKEEGDEPGYRLDVIPLNID